MLALRGLLRVRNLALVLVPAVAVAAVALSLGAARVDPALSGGALVVATAPAPLVAPEVVGRLRGRADLAGALVLGTVILAILVAASRGALASGAGVIAVEAYAIAMMFANALPPVRDLVLVPIRWLGWLAVVVLVGAGTVITPPDPAGLAVAVALLAAGALVAAAVAAVTRRDIRAAVAGAGLRDPALAVALATVGGGADPRVPVSYALCCVVLAAFAAIRR